MEKVCYNEREGSDKMNRKGFTLVELIAMMVVIGVLMVITVPNIAGILKKNRESIAVEDINKMVGNAKTKMETNKAKYPTTAGCVVFTLKYIDNNNDFQTGVNGGYYNRDESIIVVTKEKVTPTSQTYIYRYYVRLVEEKESQVYLIDLINYDTFVQEPNDHMGQLTNFTADKHINTATANKTQIKNKINGMITDLCPSVLEVYK
ncbi:MAG: prepilin-type N-terminal cleavage/methylation domain-containing protein [Bacilli bacterium]|nr:prepilin-type N-terminal cleavage/methylation domain-containing protein [Bacilli bacterium]